MSDDTITTLAIQPHEARVLRQYIAERDAAQERLGVAVRMFFASQGYKGGTLEQIIGDTQATVSHLDAAEAP